MKRIIIVFCMLFCLSTPAWADEVSATSAPHLFNDLDGDGVDDQQQKLQESGSLTEEGSATQEIEEESTDSESDSGDSESGE